MLFGVSGLIIIIIIIIMAVIMAIQNKCSKCE